MVERLRSVIPPLITPFTADEGVDEPSLRAILRFLSDSGDRINLDTP